MSKKLILNVKDLPDLLTFREAASYLLIGRNNMYETVKKPGFPKIVLGERIGIRIPKQALLEWVVEQSRYQQTNANFLSFKRKTKFLSSQKFYSKLKL
jgi:excisionase family DNA binding protein